MSTCTPMVGISKPMDALISPLLRFRAILWSLVRNSGVHRITSMGFAREAWPYVEDSCGRTSRLENQALLDLGNAHFGGLIDDERSWPTPGKLLIDGLVYNSLGPDTPRDARSRLKWLRLQPGFHPQPYHQLASFLRDNGDEAGSLKILAAKEEAESQLSGVGP